MITACRHWLYDIVFDTKTRRGRAYGIIAVPAVIVTPEMIRRPEKTVKGCGDVVCVFNNRCNKRFQVMFIVSKKVLNLR